MVIPVILLIASRLAATVANKLPAVTRADLSSFRFHLVVLVPQLKQKLASSGSFLPQSGQTSSVNLTTCFTSYSELQASLNAMHSNTIVLEPEHLSD